MLKEMKIGLLVVGFLLSGSIFAENSAGQDAPQQMTKAPARIVYKRKLEKHDYDMAASSYEDDFLKKMMGVNMQDLQG